MLRPFKMFTASFVVACICLLMTYSIASAKIRTTGIDHSKYINPSSTERIARVFNPRSGIFRVEGGVILDGSASFYVEVGGVTSFIDPSKVTILAREKDVFLVHNKAEFLLEIHDGLACPLGQFVRRGGTLAFTPLSPMTELPPMPEQADLARLIDEGIVQNTIAGEFFNTPFYSLFEGMDFLERAKLPQALSKELAASISAEAGITESPYSTLGSHIISDQQVEYKVFLVKESDEVEIGGAPLLYDWDWQDNGQPVINYVDGWSLDFERNRLANFPDEAFGQYDFVVTAQAAGVFRELSQANPNLFNGFVAHVCNEAE